MGSLAQNYVNQDRTVKAQSAHAPLQVLRQDVEKPQIWMILSFLVLCSRCSGALQEPGTASSQFLRWNL